jgi:hypothetical protein
MSRIDADQKKRDSLESSLLIRVIRVNPRLDFCPKRRLISVRFVPQFEQ